MESTTEARTHKIKINNKMKEKKTQKLISMITQVNSLVTLFLDGEASI